jgi:hypothetical protein
MVLNQELRRPPWEMRTACDMVREQWQGLVSLRSRIVGVRAITILVG